MSTTVIPPVPHIHTHSHILHPSSLLLPLSLPLTQASSSCLAKLVMPMSKRSSKNCLLFLIISIVNVFCEVSTGVGIGLLFCDFCLWLSINPDATTDSCGLVFESLSHSLPCQISLKQYLSPQTPLLLLTRPQLLCTPLVWMGMDGPFMKMSEFGQISSSSTSHQYKSVSI